MTFSSCHRKMHQDSWGLSAWQYADKPLLQCTKSGVRKIAQKELQICQKDSFKKAVDFAWSPICDFWMLKTNGRFECCSSMKWVTKKASWYEIWLDMTKWRCFMSLNLIDLNDSLQATSWHFRGDLPRSHRQVPAADPEVAVKQKWAKLYPERFSVVCFGDFFSRPCDDGF